MRQPHREYKMPVAPDASEPEERLAPSSSITLATAEACLSPWGVGKRMEKFARDERVSE